MGWWAKGGALKGGLGEGGGVEEESLGGDDEVGGEAKRAVGNALGWRRGKQEIRER